MAIWTLKYAPVITSLGMSIHCLLLLFNIRIGVAEVFCGVSGISLIPTYFLSKGLGFCKYHRALIYYTFIVNAFIDFHRWIGFGCLLFPMQLFACIAGVVLLTLFFIHCHRAHLFYELKTFFNRK